MPPARHAILLISNLGVCYRICLQTRLMFLQVLQVHHLTWTASISVPVLWQSEHSLI